MLKIVTSLARVCQSSGVKLSGNLEPEFSSKRKGRAAEKRLLEKGLVRDLTRPPALGASGLDRGRGILPNRSKVHANGQGHMIGVTG
jgi:hypothetical protein